ncbi:uncharacterized protein MYCFIDRAFT_207077 [Pseudocercospora fijiensis CIRAD86]|uniref:Uncharacterized protein n=1 Tax=Pseudocercospora fijiensis (strain CIRAD86) TaxID=383855 RepID=M2Z1Z3_PSEFD|nr:uncharacterized protein MYCFIDRAFT_207077 [Pseudocercospora fijiensis CIRAD86]EME83835.1 hypothetical protein MYCFIDRAFT_207077 [Pseudocercospora fijiensis CIRAD86]
MFIGCTPKGRLLRFGYFLSTKISGMFHCTADGAKAHWTCVLGERSRVELSPVLACQTASGREERSMKLVSLHSPKALPAPSLQSSTTSSLAAISAFRHSQPSGHIAQEEAPRAWPASARPPSTLTFAYPRPALAATACAGAAVRNIAIPADFCFCIFVAFNPGPYTLI